MYFLRTVGFTLIACFAVSGCMNPRSFPDQNFQTVRYESLARPETPLRLSVTVEFQRDGKPFAAAQSELRDVVEQTLQKSGVITPTADRPDGNIHVIVNNLVDTGSAVRQGIGTGLTLGLVGSAVTDNYTMSVTITTPTRTVSRSDVRHALHSLIGSGSAPAGVQTVPIAQGFRVVAEAMLLHVINDMQKAGELPGQPQPTPAPVPARRGRPAA